MEWAIAFISAASAAGGAYVAVRIELRFVWRELERLGKDVDELERELRGSSRRRFAERDA